MRSRAKQRADYNDPRWQRMRLQVYERDRWLCQFCRIPNRPLSVHHVYYVTGRPCWEYPLASLITLCQECNKIAPWMVIPVAGYEEPAYIALWFNEQMFMKQLKGVR